MVHPAVFLTVEPSLFCNGHLPHKHGTSSPLTSMSASTALQFLCDVVTLLLGLLSMYDRSFNTARLFFVVSASACSGVHDDQGLGEALQQPTTADAQAQGGGGGDFDGRRRGKRGGSGAEGRDTEKKGRSCSFNFFKLFLKKTWW